MSIGYMIRRADGTEVGPFFTADDAKHYLQPGDVPFAYNEQGNVIDRGPQFDELCSKCEGSGDEADIGQYPIGPCPDCDGTGFYVADDRKARDYLYEQVVELSAQVEELSRSKVITVDDVLAALVADEATSVHITTWGAPGQRTRSFVTVRRGNVKTEHSAPTLRSALIHAALAAGLVRVD